MRKDITEYSLLLWLQHFSAPLSLSPDSRSVSENTTDKGHTSPVYIDAYEQSGKKLWRINMGPNIRAGEHYVPTVIYDLDGNGKASEKPV